jgi:CPA1 family monovalent cation:H+ antiporter
MHGSEFFNILLLLLTAALVLSLIAKRFNLPPAIIFILGGAALALTPNAPTLHIEPELVLTLFLPPLLQASAYFIVWREFKENIRPIMLLAIGAVFFTTLIVGLTAHALIPNMPLSAAFCLGAIVSPPDAVAAKALLEGLRVPRRLVTILEGESLVNDASGLMLYRLASTATLTGLFNWSEAVLMFGQLTFGGIIIGAIAGLLTYALITKLREPQLTILASFLLPWGTYFFAERFEASGVLAVVTASIILGKSQHELLDAQSRLEMRAIWKSATFFMEATIFILIGMALRSVIHAAGGIDAIFSKTIPLAFIVTLSAIAARFLWVFIAIYLPRTILSNFYVEIAHYPISVPIIISWAGMRGVVSLAIALALPINFPQRDFIIITAFMVTSVTVILQGGTLTKLIKWMNFDQAMALENKFIDEHLAREKIYEASYIYISSNTNNMENEFLLYLLNEHQRRLTAYQRLQIEGTALSEKRKEYFTVALKAISIARKKLVQLHRSGQIHDKTLNIIGNELDLEESRLLHLAQDVKKPSNS